MSNSREGLITDCRDGSNLEGEGLRSRRGRTPSLVSVVIPALNAAGHLAAQLSALSSQDYDGRWEVVVADNGSSDSTILVAEQWMGRLSDLQIVDASHQRGAAFARNVGAEFARGDLLAFCDADDVAEVSWLSSLSDAASSSDIVGGGHRVDSAPKHLEFMPFAMSGSMAVWKSVFQDLGGFNTEYLAGEDVDFSWRAQLSGYSLGFAAGARIERGRRRTLRESVRQAYNYGTWDAVLIRDYRVHGLQTTITAHSVKRSGWLAVRIPYLLLSKNRRLLWLRRTAQLLGGAVGSVRSNGPKSHR